MKLSIKAKIDYDHDKQEFFLAEPVEIDWVKTDEQTGGAVPKKPARKPSVQRESKRSASLTDTEYREAK
jgi:hypothetical protein